MKKNDNIEYFRGAKYDEMFHAIASSAYDCNKLYTTRNGKVFVIYEQKSKQICVFFGGMLVATIDKNKEILRRLPMGWFGTGLDHIIWDLERAFDHYVMKRKNTFFNVSFKDIIKAFNNYEFPNNYNIQTSLEAIADSAAAFKLKTSEFLTDIANRTKEREERERIAEEKRKAEEAEREARKKELIHKMYPYILKAIGNHKDSYHIIKRTKDYLYNFCSSVHKQDIPKDLFEFFKEDYAYECRAEEDKVYSLQFYLTAEDFADGIGIRCIDRYHYSNGTHQYLPDGLMLVDNTLLTTQGCKVRVTRDFKVLFKKLMKKIKNKEDVSDYYGTQMGDYQFRGVDYSDNFIRVGCHCFLIEDIESLTEEIEQVVC